MHGQYCILLHQPTGIQYTALIGHHITTSWHPSLCHIPCVATGGRSTPHVCNLWPLQHARRTRGVQVSGEVPAASLGKRAGAHEGRGLQRIRGAHASGHKILCGCRCVRCLKRQPRKEDRREHANRREHQACGRRMALCCGTRRTPAAPAMTASAADLATIAVSVWFDVGASF